MFTYRKQSTNVCHLCPRHWRCIKASMYEAYIQLGKGKVIMDHGTHNVYTIALYKEIINAIEKEKRRKKRKCISKRKRHL